MLRINTVIAIVLTTIFAIKAIWNITLRIIDNMYYKIS